MQFLFQMDPLKGLSPSTDSTIALIKSSLKKNIDVFTYLRKDLFYQGGILTALAKKLVVKGNNIIEIAQQEINLADFPVIFIRDEPPFDMSYITSTYLLEKLTSKVLFINNPKGIRDFPEKLSALDYLDHMVPSCVTLNLEKLEDFLSKHKKCVIKPLYSYGGEGIDIVTDEMNLKEHYSNLQFLYPQIPVLLQEYIPEITEGDKRVILFDGEILGAVNRVPPKNSFKANLVAGAYPEKTTLTTKEKKIALLVAKNLQKSGVILAGIDLINENLSEINVTCPTGIVTINQIENLLEEEKLENIIIDKILLKV